MLFTSLTICNYMQILSPFQLRLVKLLLNAKWYIACKPMLSVCLISQSLGQKEKNLLQKYINTLLVSILLMHKKTYKALGYLCLLPFLMNPTKLPFFCSIPPWLFYSYFSRYTHKKLMYTLSIQFWFCIREFKIISCIII